MKSFVLCLMAVSLTLAAPGPRKRDIDIYTYHHLPGIRQETTTHYCPEEDIPAEFIPSPPEIQSFPLPSLPNLPIIKYNVPIPIPIHVAPVHNDHPEYLPPPRQEYNEPISPAAPHDSYGQPFPVKSHPEYLPPPPARQENIKPIAPAAPHVLHESYGLPDFRQETTTLPPPRQEYNEPIAPAVPHIPHESYGLPGFRQETTLPPPPETTTLPPQTTTLPPQTTHMPIFHKIILLKQHLKSKIKLPEIDFANPALVFNKRIEFPFLKNLFGEHQAIPNVVTRLVRQTLRH